MPVIETKGAASSGGFGQFARQVAANYIEDVFSTYLYTGNGSTQTITNGIDLSTKGGLVWMKGRSGSTAHALYDTARGATKDLVSNTSDAQSTQATGLTSFTSSGFSIGSLAKLNTSAETYASWTFRKQPKFFDVVTYTGNGANRTIAHNLGSVPGCIMVKRIDGYGGNWVVYHRSLSNTQGLYLNTADSVVTDSTFWNSTTPTSTNFSLGTNINVNATDGLGGTYVAYLFAHDAGGFGAAGTDNVISCGSFTTDGSGNATVTLGWEPQWIMRKSSSSTATGWEIGDNIRGLLAPPSGSPFLTANTSLAESSLGTRVFGPTATGFTATGSPSTTYIYMAIRRGPMRTPTSGTSVFEPVAYIANNTNGRSLPISLSYVDLAINLNRSGTNSSVFYDRLRGALNELSSCLLGTGTQAEVASSSPPGVSLDRMGLVINNNGYYDWPNYSTESQVFQNFRRAPGFFDVVCYTGDGTSNRNVTHSLGVTPSFYIVKRRSTTGSWWTWAAAFNGGVGYGELNGTGQFGTSTILWGTGSPTSTTFPVSYSEVNSSGGTFVAYLFADCPGVSKAGIYVGTGAAQTINCGFTGGARFVLIKRTTGAGYDWYVWDTARGITAGNDPYLLLNSTCSSQREWS
jgi:hypothetical protein